MHNLFCRWKASKRNGVSALTSPRPCRQRLHPPTMYFPLIAHEALMFEPTETESKKTLDYVADVSLSLPNFTSIPQELPRLNHAGGPARSGVAARRPVLKFTPETQG